MGLVPFDEHDAPYFFGRERERDLILANLTAARLTLLYAASGVGKSSVLRAGVLPLAKQKSAESYEDLGVPGVATAYVSDWSVSPLHTIASAVLDGLASVAGARPIPSEPGARLSVGWLHEVQRAAGVSAVHLILDQFEEYFLYHPEEDSGGNLVDELGDILSTRDLRVNVLLSIREDALAMLDRFKGRIPHLFDNYLRLAPLDRRAGRAAIEGPLDRYNQLVSADDRLALEPGLTEVLLDQTRVGSVVVTDDTEPDESAPPAEVSDRAGVEAAGADEIETPYLQLVLTRLWLEERAAGSSVLRRDTLDRLGGAQSIVRRHLDEVMAGLDTNQLEVAARIFHHLVTASGSKIALTAEDLADWSGLAVDDVRDVLEQLCAGRQRILRPVPSPTASGSPLYEIYHDVMGAAVLDWRRRYVAEREREQAGRRLLEEREEARIAAASARRGLKRTRLVALGLALTVLIMAGLTVLVLVSLQEAREQQLEARQQELLAQAAAALDVDPARSLARAAEAYDIDADAAAREAILAASEAPRSQVVAGPSPRTVDMVVTPDAQHIVTYDEAGGVRVLSDDGTVEAEASVRQDASAEETGFSGAVQGVTNADASRVALTTADGHVAVLDMGTGDSVVLPTEGSTAPWIVMVDSSPDELIAVSFYSKPTEIYNARTGALVTTLVGRDVEKDVATTSYLVAVTGDGQHLVTADDDNRLRVWDPLTGARVAESSPLDSGGVWQLEAYGNSVVASSGWENSDLSVVVWDWTSGPDPTVHPEGYQRGIQRAFVNEETGRIMVAVDKTVLGIDLQDGSLMAALPSHADWVYDVESLSDDRWIVTAGGDGRVLLWSRYGPNQPTYELLGHHGAVLKVDLLRNGTLASLGLDGTVRLWELPAVVRHDGHSNWVLGLDTSADGKWVTSMSPNEITVSPLDLASIAAELEISDALRVRFQPEDPHQLVVLKRYGVAPELWRWDDDGASESVGYLDPIPGAESAWLTAMDVSPDGSTVAGTDSMGRVHLWDMESGRLRWDEPDLRASGQNTTDVAFDASGDRLAASSLDGGVRVWDLSGENGSPLDLATDNAAAVVFDPRGEHVAVAAEGGTIDLWTLEGHLVHHLPFRGGRVGRPAFNEDGSLLAVGTADGLVQVREVESGRLVMQARWHGDSVNDVIFVPGDETRLVSASDDTTVALATCAACGDAEAVIRDAIDWVNGRGSSGGTTLVARGEE